MKPNYVHTWMARAAVFVALSGLGCSDEVAEAITPGSPTPPPAAPAPIPPVLPSGRDAAAFGIWTPGPGDTCSKEQHDSFSTIGPDGVRYPTWHPPTGPGGCTFGHEHGRDPSGSELFATTGPIPFGLANEALRAAGQLTRHEDHVGHKIEWGNDLVFSGAGGSRTCDVLVKIHQGAHSPDAFTNNLHEVAYHIACDDGARAHVTTLVNIGAWGNFLETCTSRNVLASGSAPPDGLPNGFGGVRFIPTRGCVDANIATSPRTWVSYGHLIENWAIDPKIAMADGRTVAVFATYSFVSLPARFYDSARPGALARSLDLCWETDDTQDGRTMGECATARRLGVRDWTSPLSPFRGTARSLRLNQILISNVGGAETIYTDAFGGRGQHAPFLGSIKQFVSAVNNDGLRVTGPSINGDYAGHGVHAPN